MQFITVENSVYQFEIKRSKFICSLFNVNSEEDARNCINAVKKQHSLANHNCYAYIIMQDGVQNMRYSDDREPSGTAGMPILNVLKGNNLCNVLAVVTRYFGGIKLGTGGLSRAYSDACVGAVDIANRLCVALCHKYQLDLGYEDYKKYQLVKLKQDTFLQNIEYGERVNVTLLIKSENASDFLQSVDSVYFGKVKPNRLKDQFCTFKMESV